MKVSVFGLWHLGSVTSACLADCGHEVIGVDENFDVVEKYYVVGKIILKEKI